MRPKKRRHDDDDDEMSDSGAEKKRVKHKRETKVFKKSSKKKKPFFMKKKTNSNSSGGRDSASSEDKSNSSSRCDDSYDLSSESSDSDGGINKKKSKKTKLKKKSDSNSSGGRDSDSSRSEVESDSSSNIDDSDDSSSESSDKQSSCKGKKKSTQKTQSEGKKKTKAKQKKRVCKPKRTEEQERQLVHSYGPRINVVRGKFQGRSGVVVSDVSGAPRSVKKCKKKIGSLHRGARKKKSTKLLEANIQEIPEAVKPLSDELDPAGRPLIMVDLETTSLERTSSIIQIAAFCQGRTYNCYVTPTRQISFISSEASSLKFVGKQMFHRGSPVKSIRLHTALTGLIEFISSQTPSPILVGHNIRRFDLPVLYNSLKPLKMWKAFTDSCVGFVDTLSVFKATHPGRRTYKQQDLVQDICKLTYEAHDAVEDVKFLTKLVAHIPLGEIKKHVFSSEEVVRNINSPNVMATLEPLVKRKTLSNAMAQKMARTGLGYVHLKLAYKRAGIDGVQALLGEEVGQKRIIRVTKSKAVIAKLADFLKHENIV